MKKKTPHKSSLRTKTTIIIKIIKEYETMQKRMIRETLSTSIKIIKFRHHSGFQFFFFKGGGGERVKKEKNMQKLCLFYYTTWKYYSLKFNIDTSL